MKIDVVSASAGSGKTHRLTRAAYEALADGSARPEGLVAITFTKKAASELESRIRAKLLEAGRADLAARVRDGYIGTIHAVCQRLLREFALEAGLSPFLEPIPDAQRERVFSASLAGVLAGRAGRLNALARRLAIEDWRELLRRIVDKARENGMDRSALARSAELSREGLLRLLPEVAIGGDAYARRLRSEVEQVAAALAPLAAESGAAEKRARAASALAAEARRSGLPPWKDQLQLARSLGVKKLAPVVGELVALVEDHLRAEPFQKDLLELQAALFQLAAEALDAFARAKAAARVVDFGDMLARARDVLALPAVQEALRARLDLVLVDEFQDTSPLQLAVVTALGAVARRSVWVGDRKQAIFAFQGSDPELMSAAMSFALAGRAPEILGASYRSRPALVGLASSLFARALAPHGFSEAEVRLAPAVVDPAALAGEPALEAWRWAPETVERDGERVKATEPDAIAAGVAELLASPPPVRERVDGAEERVRPARARDVAVLAFSNGRCRQIAAALAARGIAARVSLEGLGATPEAILVRAAVALLADGEDGVAALEVGWLGGAAAADPDGWLSRRLAEVDAWRADADRARAAGEAPARTPLPFGADPRVRALREAAAAAAGRSPAEALDLALRTARLPELLRTWPEPGQRLANLEALRAEASAYEELCAAQRSAATVLGLVDHLGRLGETRETGAQAVPSAEDAVTVSTWHAAKGLEWPIVVLSQLDQDLDRSVFEPAVEPAAAFDPAAPLAGRWIRHWPWPYGGMTSSLALADAAEHEPEARAARSRDERERLRLLYVGFSRARDRLVLVAKVDPSDGAATAALGPLETDEGAPLVALPFEADAGPAEVSVEDERWACRVRALSGVPPIAIPRPRAAVAWYAGGARAARPRELLNPSVEPLAGAARLVAVTRLAGRAPLLAGARDMAPVGDAVHAFLAADDRADDPPRLALAERLLAAHGVSGVLAPATLLAASDALGAHLAARFPGARWFREWPVRARLDGDRLLVGDVDLFLELDDGFVLVDHKSFPGGEVERDRRLAEWAPQLGWYARALAAALRKPLRAAFIHLPVRGELAELDLAPLLA
ncbi:UvrD-helicase domain-containing protein [Anaeromyxobacter terrae]|uniref:UvrD-helicase domain-containing protein n=1 Tax=Anaeromyxobacter terrae TaxID=2925406 RepID=UPI001F56A878|nr:UvrD-helicase domain-containing protein [Anaeromyxobacter sp. SG22]